MKRLILHLEHMDITYDYNQIIGMLPYIKKCHFTGIQIPVIQPHKAFWRLDFETRHKEWWKYYQPTDIRIDNLENFKRLCDECHKLGIEVYPDIVLRHLANDEHDPLRPSRECNNVLTSNKYFWLDPIKMPSNCNRWEETYRCTDLPAFDYNNWELQDRFYLPFLQTVLNYADGIRLDQMKHFALPSEGSSFFTRVIDKLPKDKYLYGEAINCDNKKLDEYSQYMDCIVSNAEWYGHNDKSVRFFESHDTNLSFMYTLYMTDPMRLEQWERLVEQYDNCLFYARKDDKVMFSDKMAQINRNSKR